MALSNYLWINDVPVELQDGIVPDINSETSIDNAFNINTLIDSSSVNDAHPKLRSLNFKQEQLQVERRLKANMLLPRVDLQYNFLSTTPDMANSFNTANYKAGVNFSFPLFLRKERGDLKLAKLKVQDTQFEIDATRVNLKNKVSALKQELASYVVQNDITAQMVSDYSDMLRAEERKFELGESSLFLVNARESKLIDGQLKAISLENKYFTTKAKLFNSLAINPDL